MNALHDNRFRSVSPLADCEAAPHARAVQIPSFVLQDVCRRPADHMKVAFVSFEFMEYSVRVASGIARDAGVLLLLPECEAEPYLHLLQTPVEIRLFHKPRLRQALQQARMATHLIRQIKDFKPDVIHLQSGHPWFSLALPMLG